MPTPYHRAYQKLKYIHHQLCLTSLDLNTLFDDEDIYKALVSTKKSHSCHYNIQTAEAEQQKVVTKLLWLTVLRMFFEKSRYEDQYQNIFSDTRKDTVYKFVLSLHPSGKYEDYMFVKTVVALLTVPIFQNHNHYAMEDIINQFCLNKDIGRANCFVIMKELISSHNPSCDMCLKKLLPVLPDICYYLPNYKSTKQNKGDYKFAYVYFSLWQKILKRIYTDECIHESTKLFFNQACIFNLLFSTKIDNPVIKKILNLLNSFFCYGKNLSRLKNLDPVYFKISQRLGSLEELLSSVDMRSGHIGFGGIQNTTSQLYAGQKVERGVDFALLRSLTLLCVKLYSIELRCSDGQCGQIKDSLERLNKSVCLKLGHTCVKPFDWLAKLFGDQDDCWIEMLLALLDIHLQISSQRFEESTGYSPHHMFLQFLIVTGNDSNFFVDLLCSPETCFLVYFTKYLKCVLCEWPEFVNIHSTCEKQLSCEELNFQMACNKVSNETVKNHNFQTVQKDSSCSRIFSDSSEKICDSDFPVILEAKVTSWSEKSEDVTCKISHGLSMLQTYSDCDEDEEGEEESKQKIEENRTQPDTQLLLSLFSRTQSDTQTVLPAPSRIQPGTEASVSPDTPMKFGDANTLKLDETMGTFIRLRLKMEKLNKSQMFPYNPNALMILIECCENLYEKLNT